MQKIVKKILILLLIPYISYGSEYKLAKTICGEAEGESYIGKLAVGEVVMNRVKSNKFPNTISSVVTQRGQFHGYYRKSKINADCKRAAREAIRGKRVLKCRAHYFSARGYRLWNRSGKACHIIGNHKFG